MVAGFDRYYQIAICFRDEDLRADRVQEITQLDVEMSFPDQEFLFALHGADVRAHLARVPRRRDRDAVPAADATRRPTAASAPTSPTRASGSRSRTRPRRRAAREFGVFAGAEAVRFLRVPQAFSRSELAKLEELAKEWGAKGLAYLVFDEGARCARRSPSSSRRTSSAAFARRAPATTLLFAADAPAADLARARRAAAPPRPRARADRRDAFTFLWVTDFPMFEWDEDDGRWTADAPSVHAPDEGVGGAVRRRSPGAALAHAYDLIVNGNELGGGSFRIHEPELQAKVFELLELGAEEQRAKFGFLLDALAMGAPPHGGIALGIDRMTMVLAGEPNLRDVIAFPKNQAGVDPMSGAPTEVTQEQLDELGIRLVEPPS